MSVLLCLGAGYCARALAAELLELGWEVRGTSRTLAGAERLAALGVEGLVLSEGASLPAEAWAGVTHVLASIPPSEAGEDLALAELEAALQRELAGGATELEWIGYLSSSAVYGDHAGAWVDEESELLPAGSARARRRARAEAAWRGLGGLPWHVFRLAGIYGPGRGPLQRVLGGHARRIDAPDRLFARIHRDDVVQALRASLASPEPGGVYNLCDEEPACAASVTALACELLGRPLPPLEPLRLEELPPALGDFYRDRKRLRSTRLGPALGVRLLYPSYREGLAAEVARLRERGDC